MKLEIKVTDQQLLTDLDGIVARLDNDAPVMAQIAKSLGNFWQINIDLGKFTPLDPDYLDSKIEKGYGEQTMVRTGRMRDEVRTRSKKHKARAIRPQESEYAVVHQYGVGRVPQRQFAFLDSTQRDTIEGMYDTHIIGAIS